MSVSVIIPAFNASLTIARTLESVARQTVMPDEVLVIDDGSNDGSGEIARSFTRLPIRVLVHPQNRGLSAALNTGIDQSSSAYIAILDADDEWKPNKLELQRAAMAKNANAMFSATASQWEDESGKIVEFRGTEVDTENSADFWKVQFARSVIAQPTVMIAKEAFSK